MRREQVRNFAYLGERPPLRFGKLGDRLVEVLSRSAVASALRRSASACYERFVKPVRWLLPAPEGGPIE
jgi:hypothetical protein